MRLSKPQKLIYDMEKFIGGSVAVICGSMLLPSKRDVTDLQQAVNSLYRLNDALRIRIVESGGEVSQVVDDYIPREIEILRFESKAELDTYAQKYAKDPLDFYGSLAEFKIVTLPESCGILVKLHHIIGDAWTLSLIGNQFNVLLNGETPEAYSYTNYLDSEDTYQQSKRFTKDKSFFLEQFKKCDEATYLSEKSSDSYNAERKTFVISAEQARIISDYAQKKEASIFTLFTSALAVYFNRVKMNAEKFYIGTAVLNRGTAKEKNTMGMFINTVPMLIELDNKKSFADNLSAIEDVTLAVLRHQKFNYGDVLADLRKAYSFTEKLYDVIISYQNATVVECDCETTWYPCGAQTESLQIHIDDRDNEGIFRVHYDYLTDKFSAHEIDMLHRHIENLLFAAIDDDSKRMYELDILTQQEKNLLLAVNDTAADYPRDKCVHQLFEEQVKKTPDKVAVIACDKTLTYAELNEQANRIAHGLIEQGVKPGDIVAFMLPRKSYLIAAMFGILKAGAAYLPIDPDYPQDRIEYMLSDSNASFCIDQSSIIKLFSNSNIQNPHINVNGDNAFCALHTSGSTGTPKMSLLRHDGMMNFIFANKRFWQDIDTVVSATIVTFDAFQMDSVLSISQGYKLVLASEKEIYSQADFEKLFLHSERNMFFSTPTKVESYIDNSINPTYLTRIKSFVIGGEVFSESLLAKIKTHSPDSKVFNIYGPTENTICVLIDELTEEKDITIGKPMANTQIYIVDEFLQLTPVGITGELCIAGDCVGAGYLNRPELTAEKFIDNPFGDGKLYKTGDLAYWREDGNIVYIGRNDFQVKIRGLRIELGEIENAISSVEGISQAVVIVRKNDEGRQLICAFYIGKEVDAKEIRSQIGSKLPKYMLPHLITHIDEMPLTSSGKVNRKALPEVDLYHIDSAVEYVAPSTEQEKILINAIESILNIENIGILDDFFDLGGDSLKAIELISILEKYGYSTEIKTVFNCNTIGELAAALEQKEIVIEQKEIVGDIPATAAQMCVYTAQSRLPNSTMYNIPYVFQVESVDPVRLQNAVNILMQRHDMFRTHFENVDGKILQETVDSAHYIIEKLSSDDIHAFVRPFDLTKAPLLRVGYFENTIMIDMHHIISDGSSMSVFFHELNEAYMGREIPYEPVSYKNFSVADGYTENDARYWSDIFADELQTLELNTDFPRGRQQSFDGAAIYDTIDISLHQQILTLCNKLNITPYVFYMGGFQLLLSKLANIEDVVIGMPVSGRSSSYLNTIGMFVNTVALRSHPVGEKTIAAYLDEVKKNSIDAISHQAYPFGELIKTLGVETENRNPLFDMMFAYQNENMVNVTFADQKAELLPVSVTASKCDLTLNILPQAERIVILAEYCTALFKRQTIQRYVDMYKYILTQMLDAGKQLKGISAVIPNERNLLMQQFNDTAADYPRDKCVHQLFEEQAEKTPNKIAVIACDRTLTYAELNEQANRIAHGLIAQGVKSGDIVAFMLPRKSYMIATMFGILKSGAAYLPIDPDYPQDRIDYMLIDSHAKYCVTEENIGELLNHSSSCNPTVSFANDCICYCIYTSGSTGKPKGTLLTHRNVVNYVHNNNNNVIHRIIKDDFRNIVSVTTVGFDIFVTESLMPLTNGLTVVFANENQARLQLELNDLIEKYSVDVMQTTPTKMNSLIADLSKVDYLRKLKAIILGGEALDGVLVDKLQKLTNAEIYNIYGPTEATVWVSNAQIINSKDITIGKPIANTQIYIVNKYMQIVPIGVTGELCIAGDCVGAGYLNRPKLTAEKFIDNPFGDGKLYKTGDLAYWREDGNIVYIGRNDFQVKIRGLRIELGEIENDISSVEGISQAVVVVRKNDEGRQLICAFYTGQEVDAKEIRSAISGKLPKYMLPHIITHIDDMPLTSSGKVNRKALPEVDLHNLESTTEYVPPVTEREKAVAKILAEILGVEQVGLTDDFFADLGCDSLKAIEFISVCHAEGIYFNLQAVFDHPTISELLQSVDQADQTVPKYESTDFKEIHRLIGNNRVDQIQPAAETPVGNILLTGATGYLGIHILSDFLEHDTGTAFCIVRGHDTEDSKKRLDDLLRFYFDEKYIGNHRIQVLCGDLSKDNFGLSDEEYQYLIESVDTVINSAASVKHYGSYEYFYETNVKSVLRQIEFCKASNAKLVHVSTTSVAGNDFDNQIAFSGDMDEQEFTEHDLFIGQPLDNVYVRSKFEAEKAVLEAMREGLQANIMRMGNLTNRRSDGRFQRNYESNAFLNRIRAIVELGCIPDYILDLYSEFTPIDDAANAVMTIARHFRKDKNVFHIENTNLLRFRKMLEYLHTLGMRMDVVNGDEFSEKLNSAEADPKTKHIFETFVNDLGRDNKLQYDSPIKINTSFTKEYLRSLGFVWHETDVEYLRKYFAYFRSIGYIGGDDHEE